MKKYFAPLLLLVFGVCFAQKPTKSKHKELDTYLEKLQSEHKIMGDFAVFKDSTILYHNAVGFANPSNRSEIEKETTFRIGSISKMFTATLILKAQEEGLLSVNNKLDKFLPTVQNSNTITLKNLLNHTSGITDFTRDKKNFPLFYKKISKEVLLNKIVADGVNFKPDEKYEYSNTNYVLLTFILEKVYKQTYQQILSKKIIEPLGLKHTYYDDKDKALKNEASSFRYIENWLRQPSTTISISQGAGGIASNAADLITFINALFKDKVINKKSFELMKPIAKNYGLGLMKYPLGKEIGYGHSGKIDGFKSHLIFIPEKNITICTLFNYLNMDDNEVLINLYRVANNLPLTSNKKKNELDRIENIDQYIGVYSNETFPLEITISTYENKLYGQGTGQGKFELDAYPDHVFKFDAAGIKMKFIPQEGLMLFIQGTTRLEFKKETKKELPVLKSRKKSRKKKKR